MAAENYKEVERRVSKACARAGRNREEVTLIAVSKTKPLEAIEELVAIGVTEFGENKVQELCQKEESVSTPVHWHMIGTLQRNKVKYIVDKAYLIHSVDSLKLAQEIQKEAVKKQVEPAILIEVNIGNEETKSGVAYEEAENLVKEIALLSNVHVKGLMCIAPFVENPEENREHFRRMEALRKRIQAEKIPGVEMSELSMGMTGDFEVAIEEGATYVRVGTAIFGERNYAGQEIK